MLSAPHLYGITHPLFFEYKTLNVLAKYEEALTHGVDWLQYRDKSNDKEKQLKEARQLQALCSSMGATLIINDDVELAKKVGAGGVHLGQTDGSLKGAREYLGKQAIIGITCHNDISLALKAEQHGASYVAFGRFYPSKTKPEAASASLSLLQQAQQQCRTPIIAIGGITLENASHTIVHGADTLALCNSLFDTDDVSLRAQHFIQRIQNANRTH